MKYSVQAEWLKALMIGETYATITASTGIEQTRMHRLVNGVVELTLREAYLLTRATQYNLLSDKFILDHLYSTSLSMRKAKPSFTIDT